MCVFFSFIFSIFLIVSLSISVKWLAVWAASEMTYTVSVGALNSTQPTNPINHIFPETRIISLHFCRWYYLSIFIQICSVGSKRRIFSATECVLAAQGHSRSSKVDDFGTNRKHVYDFLLVINSNFGPILHGFPDTATYWLKIANFSYPSLIWRSVGSLWNFAVRLTMRKLVMWLSYCEDPMIVAWVVLTQCQCVTDRRNGFTIASTNWRKNSLTCLK